MVEFMVIAAPRSGTTWAANWLTTDRTLCLHDPLFECHYEHLDRIHTEKLLGVSCTGLAFFVDWVNAHPARKVVLHRDIKEINESLDSIGLAALDNTYLDRLDRIEGYHTDWSDIFNDPKFIYEFLTQRPFDVERHALLSTIEMQPEFSKLKVGREVTRKLLHEIQMSIGA